MTLLALNPPNIAVNATAQYSIDNGTLISFPVVAQNPDQGYNLVSFQTELLSPGPHQLFVEYGVNNFVEGSAPLFLDYFIVQNQTAPSVTSSTPNTKSSKLSGGAIAGIIVAVVIVIGLGLTIYCLVRCLKREKAAGLEFEKMTAARNFFET